MSELPRGIVVFDEELAGMEDHGSVRDAGSIRLAADLAIGASSGEIEPDFETATIDRLLEDNPLPMPSKPRRLRKADTLKFRLDLNVGKNHIDRTVSVGSLARLPLATKLRIGVGQINAPKFASCITDPRDRSSYILRMVNKGLAEEDALSEDDIQPMFAEAERQGHLEQDRNGEWKLTEAGMSSLMNDKELMKKLKNPGHG